MSQVQVEQKTYQMPPKNGITVAHFLTVADIERSLRFYETVFGSRILSRGDSKGAPGYILLSPNVYRAALSDHARTHVLASTTKRKRSRRAGRAAARLK